MNSNCILDAENTSAYRRINPCLCFIENSGNCVKFCPEFSKGQFGKTPRDNELTIMRKTMDGMDASGLKKKFKDKKFAAAINREIILECEKIGLTLDEFLGIAIEAVRNIAKEVELS